MNEHRIIELPKFEDKRGNLSYIEDFNQIPFKIMRVYWIYDVPGGEIRGGHAFRQQEELIVALSGSFDVIINYGNSVQKIHLNRSYMGLYIPNMVWRHLENFSTNSIVLALASTLYNEQDYIRDFDTYLKIMSDEKYNI